MANENGQERNSGPKKIVIGRLAVDPVFLFIFLFFTTCSLLMLCIFFLTG
ncbi:hypothetical protein SPSYN_02047 [Sporotomaculum syntrophicum]|uniref:Uncharacterized protein n=1 Tax=Sporotomaculum syntrophicum TaxID=182264 RepID=A0A9D2WQR3_9FIRM|nr:hypothetical protein [Sporotomaculum syntrophicum]KAF1084877.1 hypothetical protein SPSYN_02047 [Sporotomaculum syntrophicum]